LKDASLLGLMRSTFKEDLSGNDTARKLLILTREIGKDFELSDIKINSLIKDEYLEKNGILNKEAVDRSFKIAKITQADNHVLRYVGEFDVERNLLEVKLISEPIISAIGQLKGSDAIFEIYTQSYANVPIVIQGASTCKQAISRGIITDILKVAEKIKNKEAVWL
jgi:homoserine dehydrogenase/aspartokinase/homoserine dehydrogenase 1